MRRFKPLQIGSGEPYSVDASGWYLKNNYAYGPISAQVTDGATVISISRFGYSDGKWSLVVRGLKAGKAVVTVTATTPTLSDAALLYSFTVEVKDKAKLRPGQVSQMADYS